MLKKLILKFFRVLSSLLGFPDVSAVKNPPAMQETWVYSLGREDSLEEGMANPLQYSCRQNPMDGGAWWAAVHRAAQSQPRLKRESSSCSSKQAITKPYSDVQGDVHNRYIRRIYIYINKKLKKK